MGIIYDLNGGGNVHTPLSSGSWALNSIQTAGVVDCSPGLKSHLGFNPTAISMSGGNARADGTYTPFFGTVTSTHAIFTTFVTGCTYAHVQHGAVKLDKTDLLCDSRLKTELGEFVKAICN